MIGSPTDILVRLKAVLPSRWFPDATPVLDGLLGGVATGWAWVHDLYAFAQQQTRLAQASDVWLDLIAQDFFGAGLTRRVNETNTLYRTRIGRELFRPRGTRSALARALTDLTGRGPTIFEPARTTDTGGYTLGGAGYATAGGWGSLALPYQCFVTAYRPGGSGIALVAGWGSGGGGYGQGTIEYGNLAMVQGQVTDADIAATTASVMPAASVAWMRISN